MENLAQEVELLFSKQAYAEALKLLSQYLQSYPIDVNARCLEAITYRKLGNPTKAIELFNKLVNKGINQAEIYSELGVTYFHLGKKEEALYMMHKAVDLDKLNPYRYASRAYIKDACKDIDGAITDYQKAIELDPDDAIAYNNLGLLEEKKGRMKNAQKHYKKSDELNNIDWDEFKQKLNSFKEDSPGVLTNKEADKIVLDFPQNNTNHESKNESFIAVIKKVFTNKREFKRFLKFITNGLKND